ncbi:MAG: hypothetical protein CMD02_03500 [Flavobacteriales bacterium]|nr:hypothetical protein [Flavobacteriales bacterium]|tara:strand:+ start:2831 stop:3049 length:219 start_codon:yes stop_codon:yes gene_type:complete
MNEKLKETYTEMWNKLTKAGMNIDEVYEAIEDYCSADPELWDLSEDMEGEVHQEYCNEMYDFLQELDTEGMF